MTWSSFKTSSSVKVKRRLCAATACTDFNTLLQLIFFFFSLIKFDGLYDDVSRLTSHYAPLENPFVFLFLSPFGLGIEMMNKKTKQNALLYSFLSPPHLAYTHESNLLFYFISRSNDYFTPPREHKVLICSFIGVVHLVGTWNGGDFPNMGRCWICVSEASCSLKLHLWIKDKLKRQTLSLKYEWMSNYTAEFISNVNVTALSSVLASRE